MASETARETLYLKSGWRFRLGDCADGALPDLNDDDWQEVSVPHDWAIAGPFDRFHDIQYTRIVADGETRKQEHTGRTGGLPHVGRAWYRKRQAVPEKWRGKRVLLQFDGAMSHSKVYVNGEYVGERPYGYISFWFDITDHLRFGEDNLIAVALDNKPYASRWYPGAGLYRKVTLTVVDPVHIETWGTYITTEVGEREAVVRVKTEVANRTDQPQSVELMTHVLTADGERVAELKATLSVPAGQTSTAMATGTVTDPVLWDVDSPQLYTAETSVAVGGKLVDRSSTRFGIRRIEFSRERGFLLNGRRVKFRGVCMHHDLGALGAAVNVRAIERQLELLKAMGCNAIRTSHNPPAVELLDLCDEMGFLVIDEAFDEWRLGKVGNGYHTLFEEWAERDLRDMIRRDRNHPSIVMWSIGNEITEQYRTNGWETAKFLTNICHDEDPTRPVTAGFNEAKGAIENGLASVVDIVVWNYEHPRYGEHLEAHPEWIMYGAETESCVSSRGEYYLPVRDLRDQQWPNLHCSAYDVEAPPWGCPPEYELEMQERYPQLLGQFIWTGFDYLGEPTPHKTAWPSRSSYFGILDLAGFPKDRYYLYKSVWTDEPVLHLFPHWNWHGHEETVIPVHCYTSYDAAELFLNGRSLGVRRKAESPDEVQSTGEGGLGWPFTRFRLMWEVPYEPGTLEVVALDDEGRPAMRRQMVTAGPPASIELTADRPLIKADGEDLAFVTVRILDAAGNICPTAKERVAFEIEGPGEIVALDNGDPTDVESFVGTTRRTFNGLALAIVRFRPTEAGTFRLIAHGTGMESGTVTISSEG